MPVDPNFQSLSREQHDEFLEHCEAKLTPAGFVVSKGGAPFADIGIEPDLLALNRQGLVFYVMCKGSRRGPRPGCRRTDTLKKAIAELWLLHSSGRSPVLLMTSHLPEKGTGMAMLTAAQARFPFEVVIPGEDDERLRQLANAT